MLKKTTSALLALPFMFSLMLSLDATAGMDDVKEALESSTNTAIVSTPATIVTFDPSTGAQRFGMSSRQAIPTKETSPLDATFSQPGELAAEQLKTQLPELPLQIVDASTLPQKKFLGMTAPDWKSTEFEAYIDLASLVKYASFPGMNGKVSYTLEADVLLYMKKRNKKGKFKIIRPNMMGSYRLARVSEKVTFNGSTTTSPKSLEQLLEALPPESILENLKSQIPGNVEKFIAEMKAAK